MKGITTAKAKYFIKDLRILKTAIINLLDLGEIKYYF